MLGAFYTGTRLALLSIVRSTLRASLTIPRVAVAPIEGRAILAVPEPDGRLTVYASTQAPHWSRVQLARSLGFPPDFLRVVTPHVGGQSPEGRASTRPGHRSYPNMRLR